MKRVQIRRFFRFNFVLYIFYNMFLFFCIYSVIIISKNLYLSPPHPDWVLGVTVLLCGWLKCAFNIFQWWSITNSNKCRSASRKLCVVCLFWLFLFVLNFFLKIFSLHFIRIVNVCQYCRWLFNNLFAILFIFSIILFISFFSRCSSLIRFWILYLLDVPCVIYRSAHVLFCFSFSFASTKTNWQTLPTN